MNILILGSGGREHALAVAYSKSRRVKKVHVAPGNGLTDFGNEKVVAHTHISAFDFDAIVTLIKKEKIDFVDVAPDDLLAAGFVDKLQKLGIACFGPTQKEAEIEWSKQWARNFMVKYKLPVPRYQSFTKPQEAINYVKKLPQQILFIKASGLALGKGVIKAENREEALAAITSMKQFGSAGKTFLIEEALIGEEFSLFAICDGKSYVIAKAAQDHKTVFNGDVGPNTGGMGCVAPALVVDKNIVKEVEKTILKPFMAGMQQENRPYSGILYLGGMVTKNGVKIIEFNARWGDPEVEVILPSLTTDYVRVIEAVEMQTIKDTSIVFDDKIRASIAGCAKGYPQDYSKVKGKEIVGLQDAMALPGITVYGAGITRKKNKFFVQGGRIFHLVAEGKDIIDARKKAYAAMALISIAGNNLHFRTDIGWRDAKRNVKS